MAWAALHPDNFIAYEFDGEERYPCIKLTISHLNE